MRRTASSTTPRPGNLFYDADGTGKTAAIKLAVLANKASLSVSDFLVI